MKFKIDENLPVEFAEMLRDSGNDAVTVDDEALSGSPDSQLLEHCCHEERVLITLDLDFGNLTSYPLSSHAGILVFRPKSQDKPTLISLLRRVVPELPKLSNGKQLWIVEPSRIRIREES